MFLSPRDRVREEWGSKPNFFFFIYLFFIILNNFAPQESFICAYNKKQQEKSFGCSYKSLKQRFYGDYGD